MNNCPSETINTHCYNGLCVVDGILHWFGEERIQFSEPVKHALSSDGTGRFDGFHWISR